MNQAIRRSAVSVSYDLASNGDTIMRIRKAPFRETNLATGRYDKDPNERGTGNWSEQDAKLRLMSDDELSRAGDKYDTVLVWRELARRSRRER